MFLKCWLMIRRSLNLNEAFYQQFLSKRFVQLAKLIQHWTKFILRINWSLLTSRCQVIKFICQSRFISKINNYSSSILHSKMSRDQVYPLSKYKLCDDSLFYPGCCPDHDRISLASKNSFSPNSESFSRNNNIYEETKHQENRYSNAHSFYNHRY